MILLEQLQGNIFCFEQLFFQKIKKKIKKKFLLPFFIVQQQDKC